jgi:hypothetical protein
LRKTSSPNSETRREDQRLHAGRTGGNPIFASIAERCARFSTGAMHPVWPSDNCITLLEIRCPTISLREVGPVHAGVHVRARVAVIDRIPPRIPGAGVLTRTIYTRLAFYDIAHAPADHSNRRRSPKDYAVWEIHPVMKMEVIQ